MFGRLGLDAPNVGARLRLGERIGGKAELGGELAEELLLLILAAGQPQRRRGQVQRSHGRCDAGAARRILLADNEGVESREARTSVFFGDGDRQQAELECLAADLHGKLGGTVELGRHRFDLLLGKFARELLQ
jgi:hypothetical protein